MKYIVSFAVTGLNIFGWLVMLMIPALEITTCTMGSEDAWIFTAIIGIPAMFLVFLGLLFTKNIKWAKWLSLPQAILIPWAVWVVSRYLFGVTFKNQHFCAVLRAPDFNGYAASWWAPYWAPLMLVFIGLLCTGYWQVWRGIHRQQG